MKPQAQPGASAEILLIISCLAVSATALPGVTMARSTPPVRQCWARPSGDVDLYNATLSKAD